MEVSINNPVQIIHVLSNQEKLTLMKLMLKGKRNERGNVPNQCSLKVFPLIVKLINREHLNISGMLQWNQENCEQLKYLRNVCVMTNHSKDQDMRTSHTPIN